MSSFPLLCCEVPKRVYFFSCARSVQTPQILELSGIGDPQILNPLGIEKKIDLRGVGANLQDHIILPVSIGMRTVS